MEQRTKQLAKNSFLLSLLLHVLFLVMITSVIILQPVKQKMPPDMYTPTYVYKGSITPSITKPIKQTPSALSKLQSNHIPVISPSKSSVKPTFIPKYPTSLMEMSRQLVRTEQMQATMNTYENLEPILLIGDKNQPPDPFLKELGRCLSANLRYPTMEGELGTRGRVIVSLVVHPNGEITQVQVVKSSDNPHFDNAALYASNQAPRVRGADRFLSKPKYFVVGFIFN